MSVHLTYDGAELGPPIERAVNDLITAGDAANGQCKNTCWYNKEQGEKGGDWSWEADENHGIRAVLKQAAQIAGPAHVASEADSGRSQRDRRPIEVAPTN